MNWHADLRPHSGGGTGVRDGKDLVQRDRKLNDFKIQLVQHELIVEVKQDSSLSSSSYAQKFKVLQALWE
jgi:hypothetical protein